MMTEKEKQEIAEKMLKNPKIRKALKGLLAPLKQEGDSVTIEKRRSS